MEEKAGACFGCMNKECGGTPRLFRAENPRGLPLSPGQAAEAELIPPSLIMEALTILLPPILAFMAGYVLTGILVPAGGEASRAAAGVLSLLGTAFLLYRIRRRFPPRTGFRILRILDRPAGDCLFF
jgi:sigma-E factor negative regulatory protein RseC